MMDGFQGFKGVCVCVCVCMCVCDVTKMAA